MFFSSLDYIYEVAVSSVSKVLAEYFWIITIPASDERQREIPIIYCNQILLLTISYSSYDSVTFVLTRKRPEVGYGIKILLPKIFSQTLLTEDTYSYFSGVIFNNAVEVG